jgi:hypothetical protein
MFPTDPTGELTRQRIADLRAEADRQRLARSLPRPPRPRHDPTSGGQIADRFVQ